MHLAYELVVLVHLVGFAALLGGVLSQLRAAEPEVSGVMLWGGLIELVTGVVLVVLEVTGSGTVSWWPLVLKGVITLFVVLLLVRNRRFLSVPRGLCALITLLTLVAAALAVLWPSPPGQ
ncbi:hypothetical protein [uncultured Friedmanniella sp.]|uniref:hypothetical protein n=1 Tax=uncultured Friedmanniella sp. TaxID=335381 RepID=UPI0035CAD4F3